MGSISHHIPPLVINSLGGRHTYAHTHMQTHTQAYRRSQTRQYQETRCAPGLKNSYNVSSYRIASNFHGNKISNFSLYNFRKNIFEIFALVLYDYTVFLHKSLTFGAARNNEKGSAHKTGLMRVFILCCAWISRYKYIWASACAWRRIAVPV